MARQRRNTRNRPAPPSSNPNATAARTAQQRPPQWRQTIDSFGGIGTLLLIGGAVILVAALFVYGTRNAPGSTGAVSTGPLMGEAITTGGAGNHVQSPGQLVVPAGQPPVGGPHFPTPQAPGAYDSPVPEGNTIHSLEHGIIWLSYNPEQVSADVIKQLKDLQSKYSKDVILSPRPENAMAIAAVSWERLMKQDTLDTRQLEQFIKTNRNRSPEPGVR